MTYNIYIKGIPEPFQSKLIHYGSVEFGTGTSKVVTAEYMKGTLTIPFNNIQYIQEVE